MCRRGHRERRSGRDRLAADVALADVVGGAAAADGLGVDGGALAVEGVVADLAEAGGLLRVGLVAGAADEVVLGAIELEVLVAEARALGRDGHVAPAGAKALDPGHVEVRAALPDLVADGDGAVHYGEGRGDEHDELGGGGGELHVGECCCYGVAGMTLGLVVFGGVVLLLRLLLC